jgi:hypothetical protein
MIGAIKEAFHYYRYPEWLLEKAISTAQDKSSHSAIETGHLRGEGLADMFACGVLLKTTVGITTEINQEKFDIMNFIHEAIIFHNMLGLIDRCGKIAAIASATTRDDEANMEYLFTTLALYVRSLMQRKYLDFAVAGFLHGRHPTTEQYKTIEQAINEVTQSYAEAIKRITTGFNKAMEFALVPERRDGDWVLLDKYRADLLESKRVGVLEAERFCGMAAAMRKESKLLKALQAIIANPAEKIQPDISGDLVYCLPWVEGPGTYNRPFGLDTKHGHLVFVFLDQGGLYQSFTRISAEVLAPGYRLTDAVLPVPRKERLGPEHAARMPDGKAFQVVVEGTDLFEQYMKELSADSIWD